jgi:hypothetical protein
VKAIETLMDRMLGRAPQTLELTGGVNAFASGVIILPAKEPVTLDTPTMDNQSRPAAALPSGRSTEEDIHRTAAAH